VCVGINSDSETKIIIMDTLEAIMTRRSIRAFTTKPVSESAIKRLLEAAMNAPSAGDGRPWHFVVVDSRDQLDALADAVDQGNAMFQQAQAAILLCLDRSLEKVAGFGDKDCSCAAQNILLAAHAQGLGAVWISVAGIPVREAGCRQLFQLPETIEPFALFPLGEPTEPLAAEYRFDPARVHHNQW
jgi:nitroreductase